LVFPLLPFPVLLVVEDEEVVVPGPCGFICMIFRLRVGGGGTTYSSPRPPAIFSAGRFRVGAGFEA
jgi:hypothetical protein